MLNGLFSELDDLVFGLRSRSNVFGADSRHLKDFMIKFCCVFSLPHEQMKLTMTRSPQNWNRITQFEKFATCVQYDSHDFNFRFIRSKWIFVLKKWQQSNNFASLLFSSLSFFLSSFSFSLLSVIELRPSNDEKNQSKEKDEEKLNWSRGSNESKCNAHAMPCIKSSRTTHTKSLIWCVVRFNWFFRCGHKNAYVSLFALLVFLCTLRLDLSFVA